MNIVEAEALIDRILPGLPGWCTPEKGKRLARLVAEANAKRCVELGVYGGRSLIALGLGCAITGGHVYGIDPYNKNASIEGTHALADRTWWANLDHEGIMRAALAGIETNGLNPHATIIRARSLEMLDLYEQNEQIDILHQDGNHSEEVSCAEIRAYQPKLAPGAYWVMDDIDWPTTKAAQDLLVAMGFKMLESHGTWAIYRLEER